MCNTYPSRSKYGHMTFFMLKTALDVTIKKHSLQYTKITGAVYRLRDKLKIKLCFLPVKLAPIDSKILNEPFSRALNHKT